MVRAMLEGKEGRTLRNCVVERLWEDIDSRLKNLAVSQVIVHVHSSSPCNLNCIFHMKNSFFLNIMYINTVVLNL